jgi:hypothetical protein
VEDNPNPEGIAMTQDEEMWLRELAAEQCVIPQVTARLGPMSLWSKDGLEAEIRRAVEAEREACAKVCDYYAGPFNAHRIGECADAIRARGQA